MPDARPLTPDPSSEKSVCIANRVRSVRREVEIDARKDHEECDDNREDTSRDEKDDFKPEIEGEVVFGDICGDSLEHNGHLRCALRRLNCWDRNWSAWLARSIRIALVRCSR